MKIRICLIVLITLLANIGVSAAENANSVLRHVIDRMNGKPIEVTFELKAQGITQHGTLTIDKDCFALLSDDISTWYDGKTQWTLSTAIGEVNITTPTQEELTEINPLIILGKMSTGFNVDLENAPTGTYILHLAAKDKSNPISLATIRVKAQDWSPTELIVMTSTGERYNITITRIKDLSKPTPDTFRFNKSSYPGVQIIDLR